MTIFALEIGNDLRILHNLRFVFGNHFFEAFVFLNETIRDWLVEEDISQTLGQPGNCSVWRSLFREQGLLFSVRTNPACAEAIVGNVDTGVAGQREFGLTQ